MTTDTTVAINKFVYKILSDSPDGYSDVVLDRETFKSVVGYKTTLPYTTGVAKSGVGVRIYIIEGMQVFRKYTKTEEGAESYQFKMKTEDAQAALMDGGTELPFSFD